MTTKAPKVLPGQSYSLGASWDGDGVNFALFSEHARKAEFACSTHAADARSSGSSCRSKPITCGIATCRRRGRGYSTVTVLTAPCEPENGHRFKPNKMLLATYAKYNE